MTRRKGERKKYLSFLIQHLENLTENKKWIVKRRRKIEKRISQVGARFSILSRMERGLKKIFPRNSSLSPSLFLLRGIREGLQDNSPRGLHIFDVQPVETVPATYERKPTQTSNLLHIYDMSDPGDAVDKTCNSDPFLIENAGKFSSAFAVHCAGDFKEKGWTLLSNRKRGLERWLKTLFLEKTESRPISLAPLMRWKGEMTRLEGYRKSSLFRSQLVEKGKFYLLYGRFSKRKMYRLYSSSRIVERVKNSFGENLLSGVERRADILLFRARFFPSIFTARQWIRHGRVFLNGGVLLFPEYLLSPGDILSIPSPFHRFFSKGLHYSTDLAEFKTSQKTEIPFGLHTKDVLPGSGSGRRSEIFPPQTFLEPLMERRNYREVVKNELKNYAQREKSSQNRTSSYNTSMMCSSFKGLQKGVEFYLDTPLTGQKSVPLLGGAGPLSLLPGSNFFLDPFLSTITGNEKRGIHHPSAKKEKKKELLNYAQFKNYEGSTCTSTMCSPLGNTSTMCSPFRFASTSKMCNQRGWNTSKDVQSMCNRFAERGGRLNSMGIAYNIFSKKFLLYPLLFSKMGRRFQKIEFFFNKKPEQDSPLLLHFPRSGRAAQQRLGAPSHSTLKGKIKNVLSSKGFTPLDVSLSTKWLHIENVLPLRGIPPMSPSTSKDVYSMYKPGWKEFLNYAQKDYGFNLLNYRGKGFWSGYSPIFTGTAPRGVKAETGRNFQSVGEYQYERKVKSRRVSNTPLNHAVKPVGVEVSYTSLRLIYLYTPQRISFPTLLDLEILERSFRGKR
jgi:ribosomal protein S4